MKAKEAEARQRKKEREEARIASDPELSLIHIFAENSSPIRNMKQYLLASLYNAPTTMQLSYQNQTNHDLAMRG